MNICNVMSKIAQIIKGFYAGVWRFCFPEHEKQSRRHQMEYVVRKERLEWSAYHSIEQGTTSSNVSDKSVVISLKSYGKRILTVHRIIECLFQQSVKVNKIVLYIGDNEYQSIDQLPIVLQKQASRGLDIRFVRDQLSYTKLLPALKEFPDATIITVDDDIYYPVNMVERLLQAHKKYPTSICSLVNRTLSFSSSGEIGEYNQFPFLTVSAEDEQSNKIIPEGFGGVLYPPHSFTDEVFNEEVFMRLAPTADDLWFKAMSLLSQTPVVKVHSFFDFLDEFIPDEDVQDIALNNQNQLEGDLNNQQLKALFDHYNLYQFYSR